MKAVRSFETFGLCLFSDTVYQSQHTAVRNSRALKYVSAKVGSCVFTPKVTDFILNVYGLVIASPRVLLKLRSNEYNFLQAFFHTEL